MRTDGRLARCPLKGAIGGALFAVLCGYNIRKILTHLRAWLAPIIAAILAALIAHDRQDQASIPMNTLFRLNWVCFDLAGLRLPANNG